MDGNAIAAATFAMGQAVAAYSYFLPNLAEVRKSSADDPNMLGDVYLGQIAAGGVSIGIAGMLAWLTGSPVPAYAAVFIALIIGAIYHYAMSAHERTV